MFVCPVAFAVPAWTVADGQVVWQFEPKHNSVALRRPEIVKSPAFVWAAAPVLIGKGMVVPGGGAVGAANT